MDYRPLPCFDPRPHARGDRGDEGNGGGDQVSIHAPTRGATRWVHLIFGDAVVSIHAPTRGATFLRGERHVPDGFDPRPHARGDDITYLLERTTQSFDPRPHARGDVSPQFRSEVAKVSIHAPTRGATPAILAILDREAEFRSTPPREGRPLIVNSEWGAFEVSIHAPTRVATPRSLGFPRGVHSFDPRPHARGDDRLVPGPQ